MNRTTLYKLLYLLFLLLLGGGAVWLYLASGNNNIVLIVLAIVFLLPGRINGYFWRTFFTGRHLMTLQQYREAIPHFEQFLSLVREKPWLKKLIIFSWGMYTRDIEVMTLNNLGAANIELAHWEQAKSYLKEATDLDPKSPLPYFNLALIAEMEGNREESIALFQESKKMGYAGNFTDHLIHKAAELLARIEGGTPSAKT